MIVLTTSGRLLEACMVSANRWLRGSKNYRFPWYLSLVSANHPSNNPGQVELLKAWLALASVKYHGHQ